MRKLIVSLSAFIVLCASAWGQEANPQDSAKTESWSSATETRFSATASPIKTTVTYSEAGGHKVETRSVERMGAEGRYEPYIDVETETIGAGSDTVRTVQRLYQRDSEGRRQLVQVIDGQTRTLADGTVKTVRTTSNQDVNGRLETVQQEVVVKKQIGSDIQETTTSVLTPEEGQLKESARTEQQETRRGDTIEFRATRLERDGNGGWQTREVRQGVTEADGARQYKEEHVLRPDSNGNMSLVQRTTSKETTEPSGDKHAITERYSTTVPGDAADGTLHLVERVTTEESAGQDGKQSTQVTVENATPGSPRDKMRVTSHSLDVIVRGPDGIAHETRSVQAPDGSGYLRLVWVDTGTSNKPKQ